MFLLERFVLLGAARAHVIVRDTRTNKLRLVEYRWMTLGHRIPADWWTHVCAEVEHQDRVGGPR